MRVYTSEMLNKAFDWSKNLDDDYVKFDGKHLKYTHAEAATFAVAHPKNVEQLPYYVRCLASLVYEEQYFDGAEIWCKEAGIGNEFLESVGYQILESINTAAGQPMAFETAIGHRLRADEYVKTLGILMQPIIFGWDAYYLPTWSYGGCSDYFLQISHHSCVYVTTKSRSFHDQAIKFLLEHHFDFLSGGDGMVSRYLSKPELIAMRKPE